MQKYTHHVQLILLGASAQETFEKYIAIMKLNLKAILAKTVGRTKQKSFYTFQQLVKQVELMQTLKNILDSMQTIAVVPVVYISLILATQLVVITSIEKFLADYNV